MICQSTIMCFLSGKVFCCEERTGKKNGAALPLLCDRQAYLATRHKSATWPSALRCAIATGCADCLSKKLPDRTPWLSRLLLENITHPEATF